MGEYLYEKNAFSTSLLFVRYVNPTTNSLIVGRMRLCPYEQVFNSKLKAYSESGLMVEYTDLGPNQDLYRKIIAIGKTELEKYKHFNH